VKVEHAVDERAIVELARRLAAESGISAEKLLGSTQSLPAGEGSRVIEGEVVAEAGASGAADAGGT
jgi:hypothetical protein